MLTNNPVGTPAHPRSPQLFSEGEEDIIYEEIRMSSRLRGRGASPSGSTSPSFMRMSVLSSGEPGPDGTWPHADRQAGITSTQGKRGAMPQTSMGKGAEVTDRQSQQDKQNMGCMRNRRVRVNIDNYQLESLVDIVDRLYTRAIDARIQVQVGVAQRTRRGSTTPAHEGEGSGGESGERRQEQDRGQNRSDLKSRCKWMLQNCEREFSESFHEGEQGLEDELITTQRVRIEELPQADELEGKQQQQQQHKSKEEEKAREEQKQKKKESKLLIKALEIRVQNELQQTKRKSCNMLQIRSKITSAPEKQPLGNKQNAARLVKTSIQQAYRLKQYEQIIRKTAKNPSKTQTKQQMPSPAVGDINQKSVESHLYQEEAASPTAPPKQPQIEYVLDIPCRQSAPKQAGVYEQVLKQYSTAKLLKLYKQGRRDGGESTERVRSQSSGVMGRSDSRSNIRGTDVRGRESRVKTRGKSASGAGFVF